MRYAIRSQYGFGKNYCKKTIKNKVFPVVKALKLCYNGTRERLHSCFVVRSFIKRSELFVISEKRIDKNGLTEAEFLKDYSSDIYPKPSLTADVAVISKTAGSCRVLLIKRGGHPYLGCWAFPGGFANMNECIEQTAVRELEEETGISGVKIQPIGFFSRPGRDPRGWVVTQAFLAQVSGDIPATAQDDAADAAWFDLSYDGDHVSLESAGKKIAFSFSVSETVSVRYETEERLAFDHAEVLVRALRLVK